MPVNRIPAGRVQHEDVLPPRAAWSGRSASGGRTSRDRVLDAAITAISRYGVERLSISGVATAAGVSRPTVYSHFSTREELIAEALARAAETVLERVMSRALKARTAEEFVIEAFVAARQEIGRDPSMSPIAEIGADSPWLIAGALSPQAVAMAKRCLQPLLHYEDGRYADIDLDEITETTVRMLLSVLQFSSPRVATDAKLRAYLRRRLLPAIGLAARDS
jgi:AcrR family transcriptional regulator